MRPSQPAARDGVARNSPPRYVERLPENTRAFIQRQEQTADMLKRELMTAYTSFRYGDVVAKARTIVVRPELPRDVRVQAAILAGASEYLLGNRSEAEAWFRRAHLLDPGVRPNRSMFPDDIVRLYTVAIGGNPERNHVQGNR